MDKENTIFWVVLGLVLILSLINTFNQKKVPEKIYTDGNWNYGWMCSQYSFYKQEDAENGWNCQLNQCVVVQDDPKVEKCVCELNNLSVNRICVSQLYIRDYPWFTFNKAQRVNGNINISMNGGK